MSKERNYKEINFSVRSLQANFATVDSLNRLVTIGGNGAVANMAPITPGQDANLLRLREASLKRRNAVLMNALEGMKGLPASPRRVANLQSAISRNNTRIAQINDQRRALKIANNPNAAAQLAGQVSEINAKRNHLLQLGVNPANLDSIEKINHELSIRGLPNIGNYAKAARTTAPVVATPVAGNAFDRTVRKIGGMAKRHPVLAGIAGLAAIGGAVRIANARDDGRIDPDSYYIMDNNSLSMVPRAFPSREAAMYIRDERYPGCAVNKGTTLLQKA